MKILVLAQEIGTNAPGILYDRLLQELGRLCRMDVAVVSYEPSSPLTVEKVYRIPYPRMKYAVKKAMLSVFGRDPVSRWLCRKLRGIKPGEYDAVLSLCSNDRFWALEAGAFLKRRLGCPWGCYFVDAIPAPLNWFPDSAYRRAVVRTVRRCCGQMDFLASLCEEMLRYQLSLLPGRPKVTDVLLPSIPSVAGCSCGPRPEGPCRFLYAGRIYGRRSAKHLLEAFSLLIREIPDAELVFAGTERTILDEAGRYGEELRAHVILLPWVSDISEEVLKATALIDLDAEVDGDVFLSSKMFTYLAYDRPVICETGMDSPSRRVFSGIPSILQCGHDARELKTAMAEVVRRSGSFDYSDRDAVREKASAAYSARRLHDTLKSLCP
jgi:glycosyltransferase involved in cell wall biosynthesis